MIIRQLQPKDRFAAKALWQDVFCDTSPFANFYFSRRYTPTLSFGAFDGWELVSMALGRRVRIGAPACEAVLIAGVSTLPDYRHRGLMRETMTRLLQNAIARGYDLALLSPAIEALYAPFGFKPISHAVEVTVQAPSAPPERVESISPETPRLAERLLPIYRGAMRNHPLMPYRRTEEMTLRLRETAADEGAVLAEAEGHGYLLFVPKGEGIDVLECFATDTETYRLLLETAACRSKEGSVTALLPADCGLGGTPCRPIHALVLNDAIDENALSRDRRTFCAETY